MDDSPAGYLIYILILLVLAGYFAGTEIALASVNRIRMSTRAENGDRAAKRVLYVLDHFDKALTTLLIGNNVTHAGIATLATLVVFFVGEMVPKVVAKTMPLDDVLSTMRREHSHMVVVTDEYGGVMGLLTMEDVMEQLVGDIWDESDVIEPEIVEICDGCFEIDGDMRIEDLFDEIDFDDRNFDDDNSTVGGFVVELLGRYAQLGDTATYENITFTVTEVAKHRIIKLNVQVTPVEEETEELY